MNKSELIKLCEEKLIEHHSFLNGVGEITLQQRLISNQAINQISWFIEKLKNLNEETVSEEKECVHQKCSLDNCPHVNNDNVTCHITRI